MPHKPFPGFAPYNLNHIYRPENSSYSTVLQSCIQNLRFNASDAPKPALILTALHESHVQAAIVCARKLSAGAILGEVYHGIAEKSKVHGFPAAVCSMVGIGGHFAEKSKVHGYGNMMRKYGLSVDNIVNASINNVKGEILDRESMGEDIFWAIRGGGGANFGVILTYKSDLVHVPEMVTVFRIHRTWEQNATEVVYKWRTSCMRTSS
ncbi:hypothetical protein NL676_012201 [Syzygium grande]|nr:hypothetical protein NL676_012201 [Syzygium grande]